MPKKNSHKPNGLQPRLLYFKQNQRTEKNNAQNVEIFNHQLLFFLLALLNKHLYFRNYTLIMLNAMLIIAPL